MVDNMCSHICISYNKEYFFGNLTMQDFTKRIAIQEGFKPEFLFNQIYTVHGVRYYVSVKDKDRRTLAFNMEEKNGRWKIVDAPKVPDWIINIEDKLEEAILKSGLHN